VQLVYIQKNLAKTITTAIVENQVEPDEDGNQFYDCSSNIPSSKSFIFYHPNNS
jgi:hypothetical protein